MTEKFTGDPIRQSRTIWSAIIDHEITDKDAKVLERRARIKMLFMGMQDEYVLGVRILGDVTDRDADMIEVTRRVEPVTGKHIPGAAFILSSVLEETTVNKWADAIEELQIAVQEIDPTYVPEPHSTDSQS